MQLLSIGFKDGYKEAVELLNSQIDFFRNEGLFIDTRSYHLGDMLFLNCDVDEAKNTKYNNVKNIMIHYLANCISDIIINVYQGKILNRLVKEYYTSFNKADREKIQDKALDYLSRNELITTEGIIYKISRKARIIKAVIEYLEDNHEINIEGFIHFRLRFFVDSLYDAAERAAEDIIVEKEYKEFIKVLQYFVDIQEPKIDLVNVLIKGAKDYVLFDNKKRIINNDFLEEIADEIADSDINYDDLLISSLITIAPRKIIVHMTHNSGYYTSDFKDIIKIIQSVFVNKVELCKGCELCNNAFKGVNNKET